MYKKYIKRLIDVVCAILALIVFCWLFVLIAILVKIKLGSPVIFKQERPGKDEKIFRLYKFRTMTNEKDENGVLLSDEKRLTSFGIWLRKYSLDEIPEAINILRGDMSVVGPRPLLIQYLPLYNDEQKRRHILRPGLTGYAQINGRNVINWEVKFSLDIMYLNEVTFWNDFKIIMSTIKKLFLKKESISFGSITMPLFTGTQNNEMQNV